MVCDVNNMILFSLDIYSDTFILYLYFLYIFIFPCQGLDLIENNFIWFYMFVIDEEGEEESEAAEHPSRALYPFRETAGYPAAE